jgi:hypothetical protein
MPNRSRTVRLTEVFSLDGAGVPKQVHFPVVGKGKIGVGPACATRGQAEAGLGHVLEINVTSPFER